MIKAKLLYSKPNKQGETVLYLGKGINRLEIVSLEGEDITIESAKDKIIQVDDGTKLLLDMILDYGNKKYEEGKKGGDV